MNRTIRCLALVVVLVGVAVPAARAVVEPPVTGADVNEACDGFVGSGRPDQGRFCKGLEKGGSALSHVCRQADDPVSPDLLAEECSVGTGFVVSEAKMAAWEAGWAHRALELQRRLDGGVPFRLGLWPGTHNSATSAAYFPSLSGLDDNQQYTIGDQLRMDLRALELDLHWWPHPAAEPADGGFAPVLCHGTAEHVGCSNDRHAREGFEEVAAWLARPDAQDEVLVVYLEDHLDVVGSGPTEQGHERAAAVLLDVLGDEIYGAGGGAGGCTAFPLELTKDDVLAAGKRVVLTSAGCGPGATWRGLVFDHSDGAVWEEHQPEGFAGAPGCGADFTAAEYEAKWNRYYEDSTWVSHMASGPRTRITAGMLGDMVECGVNLISLDQVRPDDGRLERLVWSWAVDEPAGGACGAHGPDDRFVAVACGRLMPAACRSAAGAWVFPASSVRWRAAADSCPAGSSFAVPRTAPENVALAAAKASAGLANVWIATSAADWE